MGIDIDYAIQSVIHFNAAAEKHDLAPNEYIVWHALVAACSTMEERSDYYYYAVSTADVVRQIRMQRETVRRCLMKLEAKQLAKRIGDRWIFQLDGNEE